MKYGFCKLKCFEMESGFDGTEYRFYFDRKLYIQKKKGEIDEIMD